MGHVTAEHLRQSNIVLPPADVSIKYDETIASLISRYFAAGVEIQELAELRDWLLPMLMNGQVFVAN